MEFLVALVTPFTRGGRQIDWGWLRRLVEKLELTEGLTGLWVNGTTGEWYSLSIGERKQMLENTVDATSSHTKVYQGVQSIRLEDAIELSKHARESGADAVFTLPPAFRGNKPETLERLVREVNKAFDGPIFLYINPSVTGSSPAPNHVVRLVAEGLLQGAKITTININYIEQLALELESQASGKDFALLAGSETLLPSTLPLGAKGVVSALANLAPSLPGRIVHALQEGRLEETRSLLRKVLEARELLSKGRGFIPGLKRALQQACRRFPPYVRPPTQMETRIGNIRSALELLSEHTVKC